MEIVTIDLPFEAQAGHFRSRPQSTAPVPVNPRSVNANSEGRRKKTKNAQSNLLSTILPASPGRLKLEKFGTIASSATAGSSNDSVPGKNRLPAIPCAWAE